MSRPRPGPKDFFLGPGSIFSCNQNRFDCLVGPGSGPDRARAKIFHFSRVRAQKNVCPQLPTRLDFCADCRAVPYHPRLSAYATS
jgi:hypothetical protein